MRFFLTGMRPIYFFGSNCLQVEQAGIDLSLMFSVHSPHCLQRYTEYALQLQPPPGGLTFRCSLPRCLQSFGTDLGVGIGGSGCSVAEHRFFRSLKLKPACLHHSSRYFCSLLRLGKAGSFSLYRFPDHMDQSLPVMCMPNSSHNFGHGCLQDKICPS